MEVRNVYDLANAAADRLERGEVQPREAMRRLAREVVLEAAKVCEVRGPLGEPVGGSNKPMMARAEARKCAAAVRHLLLCREDERICYYCDGAACTQCENGVVTVGRRA